MPLCIAILLAISPKNYKEPIQNIFSSFFWAIQVHIRDRFHTTDEKNLHQENSATQRALQEQINTARILETKEKSASDELFKKSHPYQIVDTIFYERPPIGALWIQTGSQTWQNQEFPLEKFCPVLSNGSLLGYIEYIGEKSSRVLLIENPKIFTAVRVRRDIPHLNQLSDLGRRFQEALQQDPRNFSLNEASFKKCVKAVDAVLSILNKEMSEKETSTKTPLFLAYGYLKGSSLKDQYTSDLLYGTGFSCDQEHENSSKRDLRTGKRSLDDAKIAIIMPDDLLETTGLDGLFPQALPVATVTKVLPLAEGDAFYTIEAHPNHPKIESISSVTILPALPKESKKPQTPLERILLLIESEEELTKSQ